MATFAEYTATELVSEVEITGLWWTEEDEDVAAVEANLGQHGDAEDCVYVIMTDGTRHKLNGTALRAGWDRFAQEHPNAYIVGEVKAGRWDVDAEVACVMAQMVVFGEVVYG